jgi:1-acyl-sn-glycerol-3-phosphate acyltransferase
VVSNHVSGLDPLLLLAASRRPLRFIIAREQYDRWYLKWLFDAAGCIPIERSKNPLKALRVAQKALDAGQAVALFPHGGIRLDHELQRPLKRGVVLLAQATKAPVFAVRIDGVAGAGSTLTAVARRSARVRLRCFKPLYFVGEDRDFLLTLEGLLLPPRKKPHER